jgi:hypothetical protein
MSAPAAPIGSRRAAVQARIREERAELAVGLSRVLQPLRAVDNAAVAVRRNQHWAYPLAPVLLVLAVRFRPRFGSAAALGLRLFSGWRLARRLLG